MNIQILIFEGFDELDAVGPFEVLKLAGSLTPEFQTQLVTLDAAEQITANHGMQVRPQGRLGESAPDIVIVPGGGWIDRAPVGAREEARRGVLPARIAQLHGAGVTMASVCTGAMLLAVAGLLQGRPATTNHAALDDLQAAGAQIVRARVVDDGDVITAGGITSGFDLALWIIERFADPQLAQAVETKLEYERRGTVWRRSRQ